MRGVSKTFGAHRVLSGVDLTVDPGEIHGLAGQNGSGKSTLIKILTGVHHPDHGSTISVDGRSLALPVRWPEAHAAGVAVVHQDLGLLDHLTVAENVCVGGFPTRWGTIDRAARDRLTGSTLARVGADVEPTALVGELTTAERAEVAIARALRDHAPGRGVIVLDESTRLLRGNDLSRVHNLLRRLADSGTAIVLISHNMTELCTLPHRVTVLRDGHVAAQLSADDAPIAESGIARAMLGEAVATFSRGARPSSSDGDGVPAVRVSALGGRRVRDVSFTLGRGEILGITGVPGSGYEEIPSLLAGASNDAAGELQIGDRRLDLARTDVLRALRAGIVLVPERRDRDGLAMEMTLTDNITLPRLRDRPRLRLDRAWQHREAAEALEANGVRPAAPRALARQLSGGNQQKVLLAKWMSLRPTLLVLHEPTQAVDVGARRDILDRIAAAAGAGTSVLIVSSEADDLTALCDRILIHRPEGVVEADVDDTAALLDHVFAQTTKDLS